MPKCPRGCRYSGRGAPSSWSTASRPVSSSARPTGRSRGRLPRSWRRARPRGPRVAAWYRATAALMQQWGDCDLLGCTSRPARRCSRTTRCSRCIRARSARFSATRGSTNTCGSAARPRAWASRHWRAATALRLIADRLGPVPTAAQRDQGRARSRQARAAPCPDARPDAARSAHPPGARPESAGRRSGGGRGRPARAGGAAAAVLGVLRGADPRAQRGTARALRRGGRRLRARRRALPRRAVGRDRPQPRRAGAGAGGRRAEDPRRRRRPVSRPSSRIPGWPTSGSTIRTPRRCSRPGGQVLK